jgi:hypothetical protein
MKKVLKKGKRGNKKERLVADEEMLNLDDSSSRIELIQMLMSYADFWWAFKPMRRSYSRR